MTEIESCMVKCGIVHTRSFSSLIDADSSGIVRGNGGNSGIDIGSGPAQCNFPCSLCCAVLLPRWQCPGSNPEKHIMNGPYGKQNDGWCGWVGVGMLQVYSECRSAGLQGNPHCKNHFILAFFRCILTIPFIQVLIIVDSSVRIGCRSLSLKNLSPPPPTGVICAGVRASDTD